MKAIKEGKEEGEKERKKGGDGGVKATSLDILTNKSQVTGCVSSPCAEGQ